MSAVLQEVALRALAPLDRLRALWLRALGPFLRPLLRLRSQRVGLQAALLASLSLALALRVPLWLLALGPLVLGVPHLLSDVRYLLARQGLFARPWWCTGVFGCLLGAVLQPGRGWGSAAVLCSVLLARGSHARRALAALGCAVCLGWAARLGPRGDVIFAHAHNLVAIACWAVWARGARWQLVPALAVCALGCTLVLSGRADALLLRSLAHASLDAQRLIAGLAPTAHPLWALRFTVCFAFMQSVHYGVWLRSLPDEDRARPGVRGFQSSYRALVADVGAWLPAAACLLALGLGVAAGFDLYAARSGYLRLALFHGPLELAVLALLWMEGRAPARAG